MNFEACYHHQRVGAYQILSKFQYHAIAMPKLTPLDCILEVTRQLKDIILQQSKRAAIKGMEAIEMLLQEMTREQKEKLPKNNVQEYRSVQNKDQARGQQDKKAKQARTNNHTESTLTTA